MVPINFFTKPIRQILRPQFGRFAQRKTSHPAILDIGTVRSGAHSLANISH